MMTYRKLWLVGLILLTHIVYLFPVPALGMEKIWRDWQRDQQRQRVTAPAAPREVQTQPQYNEPGKTEFHGATTQDGCRKMAERFKREGRRVTLTKTYRSKNPGAVLVWTCVFEGEDAEFGHFDEKRF